MQSIQLENIVEFTEETSVRKVPFETERLRVILLFLEKDQETVPYKVPVSDAFLYVIKGRGVITVENEEQDVKEGSLIFIPADAKRGLRASERMVALSASAPPQKNLIYPASDGSKGR